MKFLLRIADYRNKNSLANRLRQRRIEIFRQMLNGCPKPVRLLDVGGTEEFWVKMGFADSDSVDITLLNVMESSTNRRNVKAVAGDACDMAMFPDKSFDVVFSNSVIEHVGTFDDQRRMAEEVKRVGHKYFIQTPNRYFPIEPHFLLPYFQFYPVSLRMFLAQKFAIGYLKNPISDPEYAKQYVTRIRLLSLREFRQLFPEGRLWKEKILLLSKSFVIYSE